MVFLLRYSFLIRKFFYTFIKKLFSYIVIYTEVFPCFYQETILLYCYLYRSFSVLLSRNYSPILLSIQKFFCASIKKPFSYIVIYTEVFLCFYQETISLYFYLSEVFLYFYQETIPLYCYLYRSFSMLLYFSLNFNIYGIHSSHQVIS